MKIIFLLVVIASQTKTKVQKANSVISSNNIITSYHLSCICFWKWNRLVKDDPGCFEKKLFYKIWPRIFWNSVAGKKRTLHCLRLGDLKIVSMHCIHKKKNVMLYKIPAYMCIANLKCVLLILSSVANRNCPLHLFKTEVHNY